MLVLNRKAGERIQIGDDIVIVVTKLSGNRVSVGIDAPRDVTIRRGELREKSSAEKRTLSESSGGDINDYFSVSAAAS